VAPTLYDLSRDELAAVLDGEPRFRVDQVWTGLYEQHLSPEEMTTLPKALRARLASALPAALTPASESVSEGGDTVKWLWNLGDGAAVETVLMHYPDRSTACVSTQAGCAMACGFCATGQAGYERNLTVGEIVEQVVRATRTAAEGATPRRLSNIVFMGMGEPMANYDRVWKAIRRIHGDIGLSARHLTLSTVGIVPGIRRMAGEDLPVNLAVSLHAANDELRDELVPINRRYPLADLYAACEDYLAVKNRRLSFEWALIDGVNDRGTDAEELAVAARRLRAHVNLIPLNATPGWPTTGSSPERVAAFRDHLRALGVNATVRANRGNDIDAACGQLRANHEVTLAAPTRRRAAPA
jgi:23S rRNA (adenine2503-C2)-methyltransferase